MADPTFYRSAQAAAAAPPERLAYVATLNTPGPDGEARPDAIVVLDTDPQSPSYGRIVGRVDMPHTGAELHHFGWNACSACLCHVESNGHAGHSHDSEERRYLVVPGLRSSRIYIIDTKPDPTKPTIVKTIEPDELAARTGYSRPHTSHCGPDGIYMSALGAADGNAPGGIFVLDPGTFEIRGAWERDRGPQNLAYDFWWHLNHDTLISSEWGTPNMVESGLDPSLIGQFGHQLHVWDLAKGTHLQTIDLGPEQQMVLELRPSHDPDKTYGFVGVVVSTADLSASVWTWYRDDDGQWKAVKTIEIPAEPASAEQLPPALQPFGALPPLVTTSGAGAPGNSASTTCRTRSTPSSPARSTSAASSTRAPTRRPARSTAARRWWRSAATASGSTSRTRSMPPGTPSSIRRASRAGS